MGSFRIGFGFVKVLFPLFHGVLRLEEFIKLLIYSFNNIY
jgi:hypothetical protein